MMTTYSVKRPDSEKRNLLTASASATGTLHMVPLITAGLLVRQDIQKLHKCFVLII